MSDDWGLRKEVEIFNGEKLAVGALLERFRIHADPDGRIRFEHDSPRELLLGTLACLFLVAAPAALVLLADALDFFPEASPLPAWLNSPVGVALVAALTAFLFFRLYRATSDYHAFVPATGRFIEVRSFRGRARERLICPRGKVLALALDGVYRTSRHRSWWEYGISLVTRDGKKLRIGGAVEEGPGYTGGIQCLEWLQETFELPIAHDSPERQVRVRRIGIGQFGVAFEVRSPYSLVDNPKVQVALATLAGMLLLSTLRR
ncbi:MAG: hypothetical protein HY816_02995 [Candidatus Wallbacteria bacterium]|nr:hypothetical protein [Candidatus Wallbacteria bacterium]